VNTLAHLGPLTAMAGTWTGAQGMDVNPKAEGPEHQPFVEHQELQPIDAQTNGPQLFYGLRYHTRIVKPDDVETLHDQVGYWLWEPETGRVIQTMASGVAAADAKTIHLESVRGSLTNGILSDPFLEYAFTTTHYAITITFNADGTWSYEQTTVLMVRGKAGAFQHTDRNTLRKIGEPTPNPTALAAAKRTP
jgi:hypothetical protein